MLYPVIIVVKLYGMKLLAKDEAELHGKDDVIDYFKNHCGVDNEKVLEELVNKFIYLPDGHRFGVPTNYHDEASGRYVTYCDQINVASHLEHWKSSTVTSAWQ